MEHYLILARSVTYAQQMAHLLAQSGIWTAVFRAPMEITNRGCAYAVRIGRSDLTAALTILRHAGLGPVQLFLVNAHGYREVEG